MNNKITDYLSNKTQTDADNKLLTSPALLFENKSDNDFGSVFLFERFGHAETDTYRITSQITDHYMEDNVSRQDHWAIAPDVYIMSGFIGEVVYQPPKLWRSKAEKYVTDYLKPLGILSPTFDSYTQSALNVIQAVETSYRRYEQIARNIYANITGNTVTRHNQTYIIGILKYCQKQRQLFNVWTPFKTFKNLAIQNISITQNGSKYKSRLEIEFKEWRTISTETREATKEEKQAYLARVQKMQSQDAGTAATQEVDKQTTLSKITGIGDYRR
ncbi:MAG: hypothetical protein IKY45_00690 [Clostridia bacterium]|nr:hypothetical protein [Clostridia bacterium]